MKPIKGLDTLRAFAVLFVVNTHWFQGFFQNRPAIRTALDMIMPDGATGVYIFFTLSGFLITSILLNARFGEQAGSKMHMAGSFFARRTLRIFPLYYLVIALLLLSQRFPDLNEHSTWFLTYTSNIFCYQTNTWHTASHTWTLAVEEQFYLCWPWLILFVNRKYLKYVFSAAILTGIITTWWALEVNHKIEPFLMFNCMDAFGIGGLYAFARLTGKDKPARRVLTYAAPILLLVYAHWKIWGALYHYQYFGFMRKTVESVISVWLIALIINAREGSFRTYVLENRVLNFVGRISYCIYLIHPFIPLANGRVKHTLAAWPALTGNPVVYSIDAVLLIGLCSLSYVGFEQPVLRLKRYFNYNTPEAG